MRRTTRQLLEAYYEAYNSQDIDTLLNTLTDDVIHDINKNKREVGKPAFAKYLGRINKYYREHVFDIEIMSNEDGTRAATEYVVLGLYLQTEAGMPSASDQTYRLPGGAFFEIHDGKISRVSTHYNMQDWLAQVSLQDQQPELA